MQKYLTLFLLICFDAHAALFGSGSASIGVSVLGKEPELGADIDYQIESKTVSQTTSLLLASEFASNDSFSPLSSGHNRLYTGNTSDVSMDNLTRLIPEVMNWNTSSHYEEEVTTFSSENNRGWNWDTGPSVIRKLRGDILLEANLKHGRSLSNSNLRINNEGEFRINKSFPGANTLGLSYNYSCWDYKPVEIEDNCSKTYGMAYSLMSRNKNINFMVGESNIDSSKYAIYSVEANYLPNSKDEVSLLVSKEINNLKSEITYIDAITSSNVIKEKRDFEYKKVMARLALNIGYEYIENSYEDLHVIERIKKIEIKYLLGLSLCSTCSVLFLHESNEIEEAKWAISSIGIEYPLTRKILSFLTVRHSKDDILGSYNSLNLQIKYNGNEQQF